MTEINRHGLSREIPADVKRRVRQECGFGCAYCGKAIVEYHHFDPPFADAHAHNADGIILLCPNHHSKFGDVPAQTIREYRKSPRCRKVGFTRDEFLFRSNQIPKVRLGNITATSGQIIRHGNRVLLGLTEAEEDGPLRLTCELFDRGNNLLLSILNNELTIGGNHFDVEIERNQISIRRKPRDIVLRIKTNRIDEVTITHLETAIAGGMIRFTPHEGCEIRPPLGSVIAVRGTITGDVGIWIKDDDCCLIAASFSGGAGINALWSAKQPANATNESALNIAADS